VVEQHDGPGGVARSGRAELELSRKHSMRTGELGHHPKAPHIQHFSADGLQSATGSTFEVDLQAFELALKKLTDHSNEYIARVNKAAELATSLPDGSGPVAEVVGKAFAHRLGSGGGVHYAVRTTLEQLNQIVAGLSQTANNYTSAEQEAVAGMVDIVGEINA
jgi:hypothetical protein